MITSIVGHHSSVNYCECLCICGILVCAVLGPLLHVADRSVQVLLIVYLQYFCGEQSPGIFA